MQREPESPLAPETSPREAETSSTPAAPADSTTDPIGTVIEPKTGRKVTIKPGSLNPPAS